MKFLGEKPFAQKTCALPDIQPTVSMDTLFVSAVSAEMTRNFLLVDMYTLGVAAAQWN